MPVVKCAFVMVCANKKCKNKIPCTRKALENGLCTLHEKEEMGAGGPGHGIDWLGTSSGSGSEGNLVIRNHLGDGDVGGHIIPRFY